MRLFNPIAREKLVGASKNMSVADTESKPLDQSWIDAMALRWKASERYLNGLETESLPEETRHPHSGQRRYCNANERAYPVAARVDVYVTQFAALAVLILYLRLPEAVGIAQASVHWLVLASHQWRLFRR